MTAYASLVVLAAATLVLVLLLPLVRHYLRDGTVAFVPAQGEVQRFLHGSFAAALFGYGVWTAVLQWVGPELLGVSAVPAWVSVTGMVVAAAGLAVVIAAQAQMGRSWRIGIDTEPTALVTHGLFRVSRNPIYLGMLLVVLGIAVVAPSGWTVVGLAYVYVVVGFQARAEEDHLIETHGDAYLAWASQVGRFLPGIGRLQRAG